MPKSRKVKLPKGKYISKIEVNHDDLEIQWKKRKKVALLFVGLNERYWSYLAQVIKDSKEKFLPHHKVDIFVWSDIGKFDAVLETIQKRALNLGGEGEEALRAAIDLLLEIVVRFQTYPSTTTIVQAMEQKGFRFRRDGVKAWIETGFPLATPEAIQAAILFAREIVTQILAGAAAEVEVLKNNCTLIETEPMEWPIPTLMRYHLFLNEEEKLKEYDYIFYLDADMRVVQKISDEVLGNGLTAAPHPGYYLHKRMIPPYEPNSKSTAYIPRLGHIVQEEGGKRFYPFYAAGGFQGGKGGKFIAAMKTMKKNIDKDFDRNYTAIWNDESHWNKYLWDFQLKKGDITFLDVSYIYPDSLIKEYYNPLWGKEFEPKIITLTKPFSLVPGALADLPLQKS